MASAIMPVIGVEFVREYIRDLWLPATATRTWLDGINVQHPPWLTVAVRIGHDGKSKRDVPRTDYRNADAPLIAEMHSMINDGRAKDRTDAARALASRAQGPAKESSKFVRLARHYAARYLSGQGNTSNTQ